MCLFNWEISSRKLPSGVRLALSGMDVDLVRSRFRQSNSMSLCSIESRVTPRAVGHGWPQLWVRSYCTSNGRMDANRLTEVALGANPTTTIMARALHLSLNKDAPITCRRGSGTRSVSSDPADCITICSGLICGRHTTSSADCIINMFDLIYDRHNR